jgi:hypothetical protein
VLQFGIDTDEPLRFLYEATATWMETVAADEDQDATGYVEFAHLYPELCFGTMDDPEQGLLQYGEWTFIQVLVDLFGSDAVLDLWRNTVEYDNWDVIEQTVAPYGFDLPGLLAHYRLKNLARDYELAPLFNSTVYLEGRIRGSGEYEPSGLGVQELGANYFVLRLDGAATASLNTDTDTLELWFVGVTDDEVQAYPLGAGGAFDTTGFDHSYLMVFNADYDDSLDDCRYAEYRIEVNEGGSSALGAPLYTFPAEHFEPLS